VGYLLRWQQMADLVTGLQKSHESIPASVMRDPRSANIVRKVLGVNRTLSKNILKIEEYLDNLKSHLLSLAESKNGKKDVDESMDKLLKVQISYQTVQKEPNTKFLLRAPQDKHKVRMRAFKKFPPDRVKHHTQETVLTYNFQEDAGFSPHGNGH